MLDRLVYVMKIPALKMKYAIMRRGDLPSIQDTKTFVTNRQKTICVKISTQMTEILKTLKEIHASFTRIPKIVVVG